jgi:hypothetical protein
LSLCEAGDAAMVSIWEAKSRRRAFVDVWSAASSDDAQTEEVGKLIGVDGVVMADSYYLVDMSAN